MFSSIWPVVQSPWSQSIIPQFSTFKTNIFSNMAGVFLLSAEEACGGSPLNASEVRPQKVIVGGGSGFVGGEVCRQLRRAGYEVIVVSRKQREYGVTWEEIENDGLPEGTHGVVNLAGQNVLDPFKRWTPSFKELCRSSRVDTTSTLAKVINKSANKPEVFVQISGVGYYPNTFTGRMMDEEGERGNDWLADLAVEWEQAGEVVSDVRRVVVRPGVVLGREGGMIKQIFPPFFLGLGGRMGEGSQPMPWIHVKDVAGIVVHSVKNSHVEGVLNAVSPQIISNQEFVDTFARTLRRPAYFPLPDFVWNLVFGEERAVMITRGQKVVPRRTLESGYKFLFPTIESACKEFSHLVYTNTDAITQ